MDKKAYTVCHACGGWVYNWRLSMQHSRCKCGQVLFAYTKSPTDGRKQAGQWPKVASSEAPETKAGSHGGKSGWSSDRAAEAPAGDSSARSWLEVVQLTLERGGKATGGDPGLDTLRKQVQALLDAAAAEEPPPAPKSPDEEEAELHRQHKAAAQRTKEAHDRKVRAGRLWCEANEKVKERAMALEDLTKEWAKAKAERDKLTGMLQKYVPKSQSVDGTAETAQPEGG